jgi:hypothetical protein
MNYLAIVYYEWYRPGDQVCHFFRKEFTSVQDFRDWIDNVWSPDKEHCCRSIHIFHLETDGQIGVMQPYTRWESIQNYIHWLNQQG